MGFLEKLKNTFFEEEYVEVEEKPEVVKKEVKKREVIVEKKEIPTPKPEVVKADVKEVTDENTESRIENIPKEVVKPVVNQEYYESREEVVVQHSQSGSKRREKFNYFDDEDFLDMEADYYRKKPEVKVEPIQEKPKLYDNPSYQSKVSQQAPTSKPYQREKDDRRNGFRPTPIISPIYGILDKNYTKDEIKLEKKEPSSYVSRKNVDLDSVREKAYGSSITNDFGLTAEKEEKIIEEEAYDIFEEVDDTLLYDMTDVSKTPAVDKVTLQDAEEYFQDLGLEYNVDYKDARLEKVTGRRVSKTPQLDEIESGEIDTDFIIGNNDEEDEIILPRRDTRKRTSEIGSLEDNLFDLIDSMYEEKE